MLKIVLIRKEIKWELLAHTQCKKIEI